MYILSDAVFATVWLTKFHDTTLALLTGTFPVAESLVLTIVPSFISSGYPASYFPSYLWSCSYFKSIPFTGINTNWFPLKSVPTNSCPLYLSLSAKLSDITVPLLAVPPT